jgi:acetyltransferase-like isoleucine patch superfamily enzyme
MAVPICIGMATKVMGLAPRFFVWLRRQYAMRADPAAYARGLGVQIGDRVEFVALAGGTFGSEPYLIEIGNDVLISANVQFLTHDGGVHVLKHIDPTLDVVGPIRVGNNVYIGYGAILMPGVEIGDNSIVGAGAVVTRSIPAGSVAAGVPARVIKTAEQYLRDIAPRVVRIKNLSEAEKRKFLTERFRKKSATITDAAQDQ